MQYLGYGASEKSHINVDSFEDIPDGNDTYNNDDDETYEDDFEVDESIRASMAVRAVKKAQIVLSQDRRKHEAQLDKQPVKKDEQLPSQGSSSTD